MKKKQTIICDPYPRSLDLIFSKEIFKKIKKKYNLIHAPQGDLKKINKFYEDNISLSLFIIGQPK